MEKKEIRALIRKRKQSLLPDDRAAISKEVAEKVFRLLEDMIPTHIALFLSMPDEVDTSYLLTRLSQGTQHTLLVPRVEDEHTIRFYQLQDTSGYVVSGYGILEPTEEISKALVPEVIIVPGVAFDRLGGRVGRGKGYYDRYFERHKETIRTKIAIAYHLQLLDEAVPMGVFDERMDMLVTEKEVLRFG